MAKYELTAYQPGYFRGESNISLKIIMCEDNIGIQSIIQSYVLHWYHMYILQTVMERTVAMICQHFYWPGIRKAFWKEETNYDICQCTK